MPATITDRLDGLTTSVAVKPPCVAIATTNITLSGLQTVGSVVLASGDRVLCIAQTSSVDNGIYVADTGDWRRAKDFDGVRDAVRGTLVLISPRTGGTSAIYELSSPDPVTIGSDALTFVSLYGANITYVRTAAEIAANATVVYSIFQEGCVERYGALGNGTNETTLIQTALNVGMQGVTVRFPKNKTYVVGQMNVAAGMHIVGEGATSVLKLLANSASFTRMLTTEANQYSGASDSEILLIEGMCFDGNRLNQGSYTGFQKEQQHPIFLTGNQASAGRLRSHVKDCFFRDTAGDGISIYWNTDTTVENCWFDDCFRSSVAVTGGNSVLRISECRGVGATHDSPFQIEVDGAGFGASKRTTLLMSDCHWAAGLDIACDGGSVIKMSNTIFEGLGECILNLDGNSTGLKSIFDAFACSFVIATNSSSTHRFLKYGKARFTSCSFQWTNATNHTNFIQPGGQTGQSLTFDDCDFYGDATYHTTAAVAIGSCSWASGLLTVNTSAVHGLSAQDPVEIAGVTTDVNGIYRVNSVVDTDTITVVFPRDPGAVTVGAGTTRKRTGLNAMSMSADTHENLNNVVMVNCRFDASVDCAFSMLQGGRLTMRGCHTAGGLLFHAGAAASFLFDTRIGQYTFEPKHRQYCHVVGSVPGCTLAHEDTLMPVERSGFTRSGNLTGLTMIGNRRIFGSGAPATSDPSFLGDIYRRTAPTASTAQQYCALTGAQSGAAASWKAETTLAA